MFNTELKRISGVLAAALIIWIVGQVMMITPLSTSVNRLADSITIKDKRDVVTHELIVQKLDKINVQSTTQLTRIERNEVKLFRVVKDCSENHFDIKKCQLKHIGE